MTGAGVGTAADSVAGAGADSVEGAGAVSVTETSLSACTGSSFASSFSPLASDTDSVVKSTAGASAIRSPSCGLDSAGLATSETSTSPNFKEAVDPAPKRSFRRANDRPSSCFRFVSTLLFASIPLSWLISPFHFCTLPRSVNLPVIREEKRTAGASLSLAGTPRAKTVQIVCEPI